MGKILGGVSDESVLLKSLGEHDNVDKFVKLTCSVHFRHRSIHIAPQEYYVPPMLQRKKTRGKSMFFQCKLRNG